MCSLYEGLDKFTIDQVIAENKMIMRAKLRKQFKSEESKEALLEIV